MVASQAGANDLGLARPLRTPDLVWSAGRAAAVTSAGAAGSRVWRGTLAPSWCRNLNARPSAKPRRRNERGCREGRDERSSERRRMERSEPSPGVMVTGAPGADPPSRSSPGTSRSARRGRAGCRPARFERKGPSGGRAHSFVNRRRGWPVTSLTVRHEPHERLDTIGSFVAPRSGADACRSVAKR
jgi:hypothetical protein